MEGVVVCTVVDLTDSLLATDFLDDFCCCCCCCCFAFELRVGSALPGLGQE